MAIRRLVQLIPAPVGEWPGVVATNAHDDLVHRSEQEIVPAREGGIEQVHRSFGDHLPDRPFAKPNRTVIELGIGGVYYVTSGIGVSLEINGGAYFGDSFFTMAYLGGALGVVVDYELLP